MHEMTNETLVFRCEACNGAVPFVADSNNPLLRCECGTPVPMLLLMVRSTVIGRHAPLTTRAILDNLLAAAKPRAARNNW